MRPFLRDLERDERFGALVDAVRAAAPTSAAVRAGSVYGSAQGLLLTALSEKLRGKRGGLILAVTIGPEEADDLVADLAAFRAGEVKSDEVLRFPAWEAAPEQESLPSAPIFADRLEALRRLAGGSVGDGAIIVASVGAILQPVPAPEDVRRASIPIAAGEEVPPELLEKALSQAGFERVPMVELPGEWSRRGGIFDVYPLAPAETRDGLSPIRNPLRLEYFGDQVESIREFDPETQRSLRTLSRVEVPLTGSAQLFRGSDVLTRSLLDYLPGSAIILSLEPARVEGMAIELSRRLATAYLPANAWIQGSARRRRIEVSALPLPAENEKERSFDFEMRSVERAGGDTVGELAPGVKRLSDAGSRCLILCGREGEQERVAEILREGGLAPVSIDLTSGDAQEADSAPVAIGVGDVAKGFHAPRMQRVLLTSRELFRQALMRRATPKAVKKRQSKPIESFLELAEGDIVVHLSHGIGRFLGIERMEQPSPFPGEAPHTQEYLKLEYANETLLYVPVTKIELVQRYIGAKGFSPQLSTIGGVSWQKQKERVQAAVMDMASDLLDVQAARDLKQGITFPEDDDWQRKFEGSFPYEDTPDQERATAAVKQDMQNPRPMDRLICGDVGYGKTEIAMRAAFKAAMAGKQVGILVPTTILAEQHLETFRERMAEFPVRVECLNRFRSGSEQRKIVAAARRGEVDIVIGTHRILSKDVEFKDLGLVVIDEEQRFGVAHKERLKQLRKTVDIMTLTATPIPRTLHMSLLGIKDISALETPPAGRLSVRTIIARETPELVREAILRELAREGQVFFVHNRVQSIDRKAEWLAKLVPEARFAVIHGQMDEELVEERMMLFHRGLVDVLLATTIIESGVDIPRANTIFIDRADHFGLADLHQLRGRVGRYKHRAYAYMMLPPKEVVSEVAERRLKAIEEFNELGAGFRIAMRDLEIRGAGNILGAEQSGHIATVGYDLYCRLLKQAVDELRARRKRAGAAEVMGAASTSTSTSTSHEKNDRSISPTEEPREARPGRAPPPGYVPRRERPEPAIPTPEQIGAALLNEGVEIELDIEAHIPDRYIFDARQKIEAYRKIAAAHDDERLAEVEQELRDRFGAPPAPVRRLLRWNRLRIACELLEVSRVSAEGKVAVLRFTGNGNPLRRQAAYARAKALWPAPETCYIVVSEEAGLPAERVLDALVKALCVEREKPAGEDPEPPPRAPRAAPGERRRAPRA